MDTFQKITMKDQSAVGRSTTYFRSLMSMASQIRTSPHANIQAEMSQPGKHCLPARPRTVYTLSPLGILIHCWQVLHEDGVGRGED
jgi:hypothetical protein